MSLEMTLQLTNRGIHGHIFRLLPSLSDFFSKLSLFMEGVFLLTGL
jgi:hypothetical protein